MSSRDFSSFLFADRKRLRDTEVGKVGSAVDLWLESDFGEDISFINLPGIDLKIKNTA
jgi:hypothetical protein